MSKEKSSKPFKLVQYLRLIKHNVAGTYYLWLGNQQNDKKKKYDIYKKGLQKNPHHYKLNYKMATYLSDQKKWKQSVKYWKETYRYFKYMKPEQFVEYANVLVHAQSRTKAFPILKRGLTKYPKSDVIAEKIVMDYIGKKKIHPTPAMMEQLIRYVNQNPSIQAFEILLKEAIKRKSDEDSKYLLQQAVSFKPEEAERLEVLALETLILVKEWDKVKQILAHLIEKGTERQLDYKAYLQMVYYYTGTKGQAKLAFSRFLEDEEEMIELDEKKYRKMILFDNGHTRIEYYKQLKDVNKVMITFDSLNMVWDGPSFAFRLLIKQDIDIIAVRKKAHRGYQQDLKREDFLETVRPLLLHYDDVMCYGFSLGAYQALYHASHLNCRILAISPRLSIHPKYGKPKVAAKHHLKHEMSFTKNEQIEPVIFYDPKNALDRNFMENGVLPYFPNAKTIKMPYAGHMIAPYLRDAGQLKPIVQTFIDGGVPTFSLNGIERPVRHYYHLSRECFKKKHYQWASSIVEKYLSFDETKLDGIKLKKSILLKQDKHDEVTQYLKKCVDIQPEVIAVHKLLAEHYIETNQREQASYQIEKISEVFNEPKIVRKLEKQLNETYNE